MQTTCESCLFSIKENHKQTGCKFNRLDKFEKELIDDKFYILDGLCNSCRNINWYYHADHPDATEEELINKCKEEMGLSYNFFILHLDGDSVQDVVDSVRFLESTKVKPKYIYILTTLDINKAKQLYIDVMPHTSINVKIDINENKDADEDCLVRRGFDIASDKEYTAIARPSFNKKHDNIMILSNIYLIDYGYKFYVADMEVVGGGKSEKGLSYYIVDTLAAKQFLFEDIESKDLKLKLQSIFDTYEKGGFNVEV
jgi:hypothetical protein